MTAPLSVRELHDRAMEHFDLASVPSPASADRMAYCMLFEVAAALQLAAVPSSEPSRGILCLSAASLAYRCGLYQLATLLIAEARRGMPSPRTLADLVELETRIAKESAP